MTRLWPLVSLLLVTGMPLAAQEPGKWGIGVSLNPTALVIMDDGPLLLPFGFGNILVPIRIAERTILEPEFGLFRASTSAEVGGFSQSSKVTNSRIGAGLLMGLPERERLHPYFGPRIGINRSTVKEESTSPFGGTSEEERKQSSFLLSAVLGAQYFFTRHFSLGGEAQLTRTTVSDDDENVDRSQSFLGTGAVVTLRWYF